MFVRVYRRPQGRIAFLVGWLRNGSRRARPWLPGAQHMHPEGLGMVSAWSRHSLVRPLSCTLDPHGLGNTSPHLLNTCNMYGNSFCEKTAGYLRAPAFGDAHDARFARVSQPALPQIPIATAKWMTVCIEAGRDCTEDTPRPHRDFARGAASLGRDPLRGNWRKGIPAVGSPALLGQIPEPAHGTQGDMTGDAFLEADFEPNCSISAALERSECNLAKYDLPPQGGDSLTQTLPLGQ
eukprot:gene13625-biopygen2012